MHKPATLLATALVTFAISAPYAHAGFTGISATTTLTTLPQAGSPIWVVKLYANFDNTNDRILSVTDASFTASQNFFQHGFGGNTEYSAGLAGPFPDLAYDSYVTMNRVNDGSPGASTQLTAVAWTATTFTGAWKVTNDIEDAHTTGQNAYLIAQLTIDNYAANASITSNLTVNWRAEGAGSPTATGVSNFVVGVPAPGALALLGIAGLIGGGRRRRSAC